MYGEGNVKVWLQAPAVFREAGTEGRTWRLFATIPSQTEHLLGFSALQEVRWVVKLTE